MKRTQFDTLIRSALDNHKLIRACTGHKWMGPIKPIDIAGTIAYQVKCVYCPLYKDFSTIEQAQATIA